MGAAASTAPSKLGVEGVKKICGDKFEQEVFDSMKDKDGFVTKEQLIALEKEIAAQVAAAETAAAEAVAAAKPPPRTDFDPSIKYDKWAEVDYRDPDTGEWIPALVRDNTKKDAIVPYYVIQFRDEEGDPTGKKIEATPANLRPSQTPEALAALAAERQYVARELTAEEKAAQEAEKKALALSKVVKTDGTTAATGGDKANFRGVRKEGCSCLYGNPCVDKYVCLDWENRYDIAKANA